MAGFGRPLTEPASQVAGGVQGSVRLHERHARVRHALKDDAEPDAEDVLCKLVANCLGRHAGYALDKHRPRLGTQRFRSARDRLRDVF